MALPIIGPYSSVTRLGGPPGPSSLDSVSRYRQGLPYDRPLPYRRDLRIFGPVKVSGSNPVAMADFDAGVNQSYRDCFCLRLTDDWVVAAMQEWLNKARAKFIDAFGASSQVATTIAEWQQSVNMMSGKLLAIARSANAFRKGNVVGAWEALNLKPPKRNRTRGYSRGAANAWLELHFGWVPLMQDIYGAIDFLQTQDMSGHSVGKAHGFASWPVSFDIGFSGGHTLWKGVHNVEIRTEVGADWRVVNPNLFLANRLGMLNPLAVAWELVPFSFVVDWFTNVGQFIAQFSDLAGVEITNSYHTVFGRDVCPSSMFTWYYTPPELATGNECDTRSVFVERKLGLPEVHLAITAPKRISVVRAATAISLLVQLGIARR